MNITSRWWSRILIFLLLWTILIFAEYSLFSDYTPWLSCITASLLTEYLRVGNSITGFGLSFKKQTFWREIFWGILGATISLTVVALSAVTLGARFIIPDNQITFVAFLLLFLKLLILAAGEEFLFRGILFQAVLERFKTPVAVILSTIFFVYGHTDNPGADILTSVNIALANLLFCTLYLSTGSLWPSIAFHFFWNFAQHIFLGSPVSGLNFGDVLLKMDVSTIRPNLQWLVTGDFGIEEGLATSFVLIAASIILPGFLKTSAFASARVFKRRFAESEFLHS